MRTREAPSSVCTVELPRAEIGTSARPRLNARDEVWWCIGSKLERRPPGAGYEFALQGVHPNPTVGRTMSVNFTLPSADRTTRDVMDVAGRRVMSREVGSLGAGPHSIDLARGRGLPSGVYMVRLSQGTRVQTTRVAVLDWRPPRDRCAI